ncbi:hypothetical protein NX801_26015 [Streptomyces sp. LP05-1]|uniref:Secreted protein n=1 Tax=Streptomyces pyxinae TaxID=2970734 RepID=A0ABT2CNM0_9ACTN|nr:hypothetical protein [Streptomyces sp. LP05-1]MCS0639040.1 hypothetical protein [Streptomyces sp. LP05-1]
MPRGRHRHSPPLHRLLPPSAVAGASVLCAGGAWFLADPLPLRVLAAAAAAAAVTGAVLMRNWDRAAGRRVAELTRARAGDQWKTEERLAELESDLEESRAVRARLDAKLRAKRMELAGLRGEHAALLRRYANAETERASALEGRRKLALGSAGPAAGHSGALSPAAFLGAARALENLPRGTARQAGDGRAPATGGAPEPAAPPASRRVPAAATAVEPAAHRRPVPRPTGGFDFFGTQGTQSIQGAQGAQTTQGRAAGAGGTAATEPGAAIEAVQDQDLADVVGEEALAAHQRRAARGEHPAEAAAPASGEAGPAGAGFAAGAERPGGGRPAGAPEAGAVIDLTEHDETEQLDMVRLHGAVG